MKINYMFDEKIILCTKATIIPRIGEKIKIATFLRYGFEYSFYTIEDIEYSFTSSDNDVMDLITVTLK